MLETLSIIGAITLGGINAWLWRRCIRQEKELFLRRNDKQAADSLAVMYSKAFWERQALQDQLDTIKQGRYSPVCNASALMGLVVIQSLSSDRRGQMGQLAWLGVKGVRR